ncbi:MAG: hypothetical protein HYS09_00090 [Chloroflexi bacterium]|nr:hypothetical protein [Chloroflexota bacterium]
MLRLSPRRAAVVVLGLALALGLLLTQLDLRLVSSQAMTIVAAETVVQVPPDDPWSDVWEQADAVEVPLSAQQTSVPKGGGSIRAVTARALHDRDRLYVLMEWADATRDMSAIAPQDFRDAAAVQFPASGVTSVPFFCMGQADAHVNIWHWKADWQADIDSGFVGIPEAYPNTAADLYPLQDDPDFYPGRAAGNLLSQTERSTPVENLVAGGFGTLTTAEKQMVGGRGVWRDGTWRVLFVRDLDAGGDAYAKFAPGRTTNVAFAVWNGSKDERDGLKSVSQFAELQLAGKPEAPGVRAGLDRTLVVVIILVVVVGMGTLVVAARVERRP